MNDLILPYLFGTIATSVVLFLSVFNYMRGKKERIAYEKERALLPDAVRLESLQELRRRSEEEYDAIQERLSNARLMISERDDAEKWLELNRDKLLQLKSDREEQEGIRMNIESLKQQRSDASKDLSEVKNALSTVRVELNYFEKIKAQKDAELASIEEQKTKLLEQQTKIQSELQPLQIRLAGIQANIDSRNEELEGITQSMERRVEQYERQLAQNESLLEKSDEKLRVSQTQHESLAKQNIELQAAKEKIQVELDYLNRDKEESEQQQIELNEQLQRLNDEIARNQSILQPLKNALAGIETELNGKKDELKFLTQSMDTRVRQYEEQLNQNRDLLDQSEKKLSSLREQIESASHAAIECKAAKEKIQAELDFMLQIKREREEQERELKEELLRLDDEISRQQSLLQPLKNTLAGIETSISNKREELDLVTQNMEKRALQFEDQLKQSRDLLDQSEKKLTTSREQLDEATRQLHAVNEERARVSADVQALQREKVALEDLIKNLRADWNTVLRLSGQDEGADERRTQELWVPYIAKKASEFEQFTNADELKQLDRTDQYLQSMRLYFPKRVLYAFHTSLKVTDISPLVVLAGISGTGKSELPRRYAEAMGLHFLNVAVQPRWDSPQDMFGFFNYLENRYRATELGRALVQMDPYYNEEDRGWATPTNWENSLSSQMMLILLDEMNLARVEYYFSEFLSRLETRRGVNQKDPQSRRKAEIGLEVGAGKNTAPIMQLFVDQNVLFVGTMNEDETTQALSDKVIDRANVLRFGRPGTVEHAASQKRQFDIDQRLSYKDWQSWCQRSEDLSQEITLRVNEYIARLDAAMSKIKRPFGFRTRNGILSYVANYPSKDFDAVDSAVADQIEQKIIPKFRGLDPRDHDVREAIVSVRGILDDLGDQLLVEALDQTTRESQFVWLGVNRFSEELTVT